MFSHFSAATAFGFVICDTSRHLSVGSRTSKTIGGVFCAESGEAADSLLILCSRGVAGGDGKSIANCNVRTKEERKKKVQEKATSGLTYKAIAKFELYYVHKMLRGTKLGIVATPYGRNLILYNPNLSS
jgi:hypothetical protein